MYFDGFVVFEGVDGSGKSTQVDMLADRLRDRGIKVTVCRDPGGTWLGDAFREMLLHGEQRPCGVAELMMFCAARAQMVHDIIRPALERREVVICDRYTLSTVAYQYWGARSRGLTSICLEAVLQCCLAAQQHCEPSTTIVLDVSWETAMARIGQRRDKIEARGRDYFEAVRHGYDEAARMYRSSNTRLIISETGAAEVHREVLDYLESVAGRWFQR